MPTDLVHSTNDIPSLVDNSNKISSIKRFFSFPNPVNEAAARSVALGVVAMATVAFTTGAAWILIVIAYGFLARVLAGPKMSPLGWFGVHVSAPRLKRWERFVPGPAKRFAQAMGLVISLGALVTWLAAGWLVARWILVPLVLAASLEGLFGLCLGCTVFGWLIKAGVIPASICEECGDLGAHYRRVAVDGE